ncbi:hypothetical protein Taro_036317, partial [Colocasia esculenta]|nr:hypothetical protein [Colocasia esculenta]
KRCGPLPFPSLKPYREHAPVGFSLLFFLLGIGNAVWPHSSFEIPLVESTGGAGFPFSNPTVLSIVKIDNPNDALPVDEFLELVLRISELRHPNIVELVGYCAEYGQRLLVYSYLSKRTLHDVLHNRDDAKGKLSWNARIQVALGAAQALEYLHESCQPPVVHQNFESSNILLDDELAVRVCDCGLAPLLSSNSVTQLSGRIRSFSYEAPEVSDSGLYTEHSDVYSFGVVMLELLTGRKPYDSSRSRAEQYLVRWASSQFYDINMLSKMVDPSINGKYPVKSLSRFADIISCCIQVHFHFPHMESFCVILHLLFGFIISYMDERWFSIISHESGLSM